MSLTFPGPGVSHVAVNILFACGAVSRPRTASNPPRGTASKKKCCLLLLNLPISVSGSLLNNVRRMFCFHQIITMADSGLDVNSCFFSEDQSEDNIECSTHTSPVFDLTKRKVCSAEATGAPAGRP